QVKLLIKPQTPLVVIAAEALKPGNRVWQFTPDDSVLDPPAKSEEPSEQGQPDPQDVASSDPAPDADEESSQEQPDEEDKFDPSLWTAGRVVVRREITPVDSLMVRSKPQQGEADASESQLDGAENQWWVCEVRGQVIHDGCWVVVSPLGSVNTGSVSARAQVKNGSGDQEATGVSVAANSQASSSQTSNSQASSSQTSSSRTASSRGATAGEIAP
ncbi:MAG: hypothetical protein MI861_08395, partial [Pirellulales bacterium]|nr:hypothetical protein [Pirellulales bacterium]